MIGSQGHLTVWAVAWVPCVAAKNSITDFLEMNKFLILTLEKVHFPLSKVTLHFLTASWSEASNLLPIVQLDFSWILDKTIGSQGCLNV